MSPENDNEINWNEVVGKEALGENGLDLGTIKEISGSYIVTEVGMFNKKIYHLPKTSVKYFNGVFLNFSLNEPDLQIYEQKIRESTFSDNSFSESPEVTEKEEMSIPLISQNLELTKNITENNIKITKEPIKETKTVEIELMHENVTIEIRDISINDNEGDNETNIKLSNNETSNQEPHWESKSDPSIYSKKEFSIPIKKEVPVITKKSFVKEEVVIKKKPVTETRQVTEEVTSEKVNLANSSV
jgi:stress response protein YsnF